MSGIGSVSAKAIATRARPARNFPRTRFRVGTGRVMSVSSVPARRSSLQSRMVRAAQRKISSTGIQSNRGRASAMLRAKKASTQKKTKSETARKAPMKR